MRKLLPVHRLADRLQDGRVRVRATGRGAEERAEGERGGAEEADLREEEEGERARVEESVRIDGEQRVYKSWRRKSREKEGKRTHLHPSVCPNPQPRATPTEMIRHTRDEPKAALVPLNPVRPGRVARCVGELGDGVVRVQGGEGGEELGGGDELGG